MSGHTPAVLATVFVIVGQAWPTGAPPVVEDGGLVVVKGIVKLAVELEVEGRVEKVLAEMEWVEWVRWWRGFLAREVGWTLVGGGRVSLGDGRFGGRGGRRGNGGGM